MPNKKQLNNEIDTLKSLETIIESYEEIAAMRMRKVKKSVLQNREFFSGLNDIYQRVMYVYNEQNKQKKNRQQLLMGNGKTVSILISSNTGLYGSIVKQTFQLFIDNTTNSTTDLVIVGRTGKALFESFLNTINKKYTYNYFELSDNVLDQDKIKAILDHILNYTHIIVYHGLYVSILSQSPTTTFVTGKALDLTKEEYKSSIKSIIEPSVDSVAKFFERQITASIFEQSLYESSLSKYASRMITLDVATENIKTSIQKAYFQKLKFKHALDNSTQLERIGGASLW